MGDLPGPGDIEGSLSLADLLRTPTEENPLDVFHFRVPNDDLELNEPFSDVITGLDERHWSALEGGIIASDKGTIGYRQYLKFYDETTGLNSSLKVIFGKTPQRIVGDFIEGKAQQPLWQWEMHFDEGLDSKLDSRLTLPDFNDETFHILGTPFVLFDSEFDAATQDLRVDFVADAISDILEESQTKTYQLQGKTYEINVLEISDSLEKAVVKVNGAVLEPLRAREITHLEDTMGVGIRSIQPNEGQELLGGDLIELYLIPYHIRLKDQTNNTNFTRGIEVNGQNIAQAQVQMHGQWNNGTFTLNNIKYRVEGKNNQVSGPVTVLRGQSMRAGLYQPESLLSPRWDITYQGMGPLSGTPRPPRVIEIGGKDDNEFDISFVTQEGIQYQFEFIEHRSNPGYNFGDEENPLIFIEGENNSDFYIKENSLIILTDRNDDSGKTRVLEYDGRGNDQLVFRDRATELTKSFGIQTDAQGNEFADVTMGGTIFRAYVAPNESLAMDLNGDGTIGDGSGANTACTSEIRGLSIGNAWQKILTLPTNSSNMGPCRSAIVVNGGGIIDLGIVDGRSNPLPDQTDIASAYADATNNTKNVFGLKTIKSHFDENGVEDTERDEIIYIGLEVADENHVSLNLFQTDSQTPLTIEEDVIEARNI